MTSKRFTAASISLIALSFCLYKLVLACSDGPDPYDYYPSFFQPLALRQPAFTPFHYTAELKYYDAWYDYKADEEIPDANTAAWQAYAGGSVPLADIDSFVYRYPQQSLASLYYHIEKGQPLSLSAAERDNAFTKWFLERKDLEALGYLMYAKQCEPFVSAGDSWDVSERDTAKMSRLVRNGQQLHKAAKSNFIRERYAYQILRLTLYADRPRQTIALYPTFVTDSNSKTEIFARTLAIKAGALFRVNRKAEAAYLYSRAFDMSDNGKRSAFMSFDWSAKEIAPVLAYAKNPREKAAIWLMDGLREYEQGLPQLEQAYKLDPTIRGLDVLMMREINKLEERYYQSRLLKARGLQSPPYTWSRYSGEWAGSDAAASEKWVPYAAQLNAFAQRAGAEGKTDVGAFWYLASAYLYMIEGNTDAAAQKLGIAGTSLLSPRERDLREVLRTVHAIQAAQKMDAATEGAILPNLQWLEGRAATDRHAAKTYRDLMSTVLATAYLKGGDTIRALYTLARVQPTEGGGFYVSEDFTDLPGTVLERMRPEGIAAVATWADRKNKSAMDAWLTKGAAYTPDVLRELEGTKYLRLHQFSRAAEVLRKSSPNALNRNVLPNPFVPYVRDILEPLATDSGKLYTKLQFAEKMAALQGQSDATSLFEYGLGLYAMSYYGKAHRAADYYRRSTDEHGYFATPQRSSLPKDMQEYYGLQAAEAAFVAAAAKEGDPGRRAQALWMAARCWQKRAPLAAQPDYYSKETDRAYYRYSLSNPYFKQLREGALWSTPFMQDARSTCDYLKDAVGVRR